ncbi:MAG: DUF362 domain-containing protein [Candidatus Latescibacteria bacterium]|nr:DUF362 domain-containing protein [Candidatus Latescibacterota bacterium]
MEPRMTRREFIAQAAMVGAAVSGASLFGTQVFAAPESVIAVAANAEPGLLARQAVKALGGMRLFVKPGQRVIVKPNASYACPPEQAVTTHPAIVAEVIKMCHEAGAAEVIVLDSPVEPARKAFDISGIREAAEQEKAGVMLASSFYRPLAVPRGQVLNTMTVHVGKDVLEADVIISVPIAKAHAATGYSLGLKSLMGLVRNRQAWHTSASLDQCIADFATAIRPRLTILDAHRILLTNGPKGPGETKDVGQVIAGTDPVAVDAYAVTLFGATAADVPHIAAAARLGVGQMDLKQVRIKKTSV